MMRLSEPLKHNIWRTATECMSRYLSILPAHGGLGDGAELAILGWLRRRYNSRPKGPSSLRKWGGLDFNDAVQRSFLHDVMPQYADEFNAFALDPLSDPNVFYLRNTFYQCVDAEILHTVIRHFQPERIIEVGSGHSTRIVRGALDLNGKGRLVSIDPMPRKDIEGLVDEFIQAPVETVDLARFKELKENDVLFVDSSHRIWPENDVQFFFEQVFPCLAPGVLIHLHDIFLPFDYPQNFLEQGNTEQDMLAAFLAFNNEFSVLVSAGHLLANYREDLSSVLINFADIRTPGCFWMKRDKLTSNKK